MKKVKLPIEEIIKKYEKGILQSELAEEYSVNIMTISQRIRSYYEETGKERPKISKKRKQLPIEEIISKYEKGRTKRQLAEEHGVSQSTLSQRIKEYYKESPQNSIKRKQLPIEEIISKYEKGKTQRQLAKEYRVSQGTISLRIRVYYGGTDIEKPRHKPGRGKKILPVEEIISKYEKGRTQRQLAEEYGVSQGVISQRIRSYYEETGKERPQIIRKRKRFPIEKITGKKGPRILKDVTIIVAYLKKGLTIEQIIESAKKKNVIVPEHMIENALMLMNKKNLTDDTEAR